MIIIIIIIITIIIIIIRLFSLLCLVFFFWTAFFTCQLPFKTKFGPRHDHFHDRKTQIFRTLNVIIVMGTKSK